MFAPNEVFLPNRSGVREVDLQTKSIYKGNQTSVNVRRIRGRYASGFPYFATSLLRNSATCSWTSLVVEMTNT